MSFVPKLRLRALIRGVASAAMAGAGGDVGDASREVADHVAQHQGNDLVLGPCRDVDHTDGLAFAEDGCPVADRRYLDQPVRDEDHRPIGSALAPNDLEDELCQVRRQGGRHLVEQEDVRLDRQGAGKVDDPQRGERQVADEVVQVQVGEAQLGEPVTSGFDR